MTQKQTTTLLVVLLAIASLATTLLLALTFLRGGQSTAAPSRTLPVMAALPDFTLTERTEQPVSANDLRGHVWIANFIFKRCPGPCPMMTARMTKLQNLLRDNYPNVWQQVRLVSVTVDPEHDTPEQLREYAGWAHADEKQWLFLTGTRADVWSLIKNGFKLPVEDANETDPDNAEMPIIHSQKFVLLDRQNRIRGYYDVLEQADFDRIVEHIGLLVSE